MTIKDFWAIIKLADQRCHKTLTERGEKYNRNGITPSDYLAVAPAESEIKVILLRLQACKDDDPEIRLSLWEDLINYGRMGMAQVIDERSNGKPKEWGHNVKPKSK